MIEKLIATTNFGLESVAKRELNDLGFTKLKTTDGKVEIDTELENVAKLNLNMRSAERILIKLSEFSATTFEELFQGVYEIDWLKYLDKDTNFIIEGRSIKSKLFSISDCQRITEKAIIKKLQTKYKISWFEKSKERVKIEVSLFKDIATITIDSSGEGLHKRGYREINYKAPISETIAASLVMLSFWKKDRILADPFCGSGTIPIEAAMIAKNIAPGLMRKFDFEKFKFLDENIFKEEKKKAYAKIDYDTKLEIYASDISYKAIEVATHNAEILGLEEDIRFFQKDIKELELFGDYGVIITNPPYGVRIGEIEKVSKLNRELGDLYRSLNNWSLYAISAKEDFQRDFGMKSDKNRKLYNGRLKSYYYQYYGKKPPKK